MEKHKLSLKHVLFHLLLVCRTVKANTIDGLDATILKSVIPEIGSLCKTTSELFTEQTSSYSFNYEQSQSHWDSVGKPFEKKKFLAEIKSTNTKNSEKSWMIRVGEAGDIYSLRGAFGEAVPPQYHVHGPWVDEVIQSVSVNNFKNKDRKHPYFIHQAGTYMEDGQYTNNNPFFSPNLAKYCDDKECLFVSWGQQAHVPTIHESKVLYFNGYRDCGNGVIEYTSVFHNFETDFAVENSVNNLNVPWGGVRASSLRDLFLSQPTSSMALQFPLVNFGLEGILNLQKTGGYSTFTEQVVVPDFQYKQNHYQMPIQNGKPLLISVANNNGAFKSKSHSNLLNAYCMKVPVSAPFEDKKGCQGKCPLWLTNGRTGQKITTETVLHWSWQGKTLIFCTSGGVTEVQFNNIFKQGDRILPSYANTGKPIEDNMALTFVHGSQAANLDQRWATSRLRYGKAGPSRRDYTAFTNNNRVFVTPGDVYVYQQYLITGKLSEMQQLAPLWKNEVYEDVFNPGEMAGVDIHLYSNDANVFGAFVADGRECLQGVSRCVGKSAPGVNLSPLFSITCGNSKYVGSNQYFFSPPRATETDVIRSYECAGQAINVRPKWKLLGFFEEGACDFLSSATYDDTFCSTELPSSSPTESHKSVFFPGESEENENISNSTSEPQNRRKALSDTLKNTTSDAYGLSFVVGATAIFFNIILQLFS